MRGFANPAAASDRADAADDESGGDQHPREVFLGSVSPGASVDSDTDVKNVAGIDVDDSSINVAVAANSSTSSSSRAFSPASGN